MERIGILNCKRARKDGNREKEKRSLCQITCGSVVMAENDSDLEELECSRHNLSLDGKCNDFGGN